MKIYLAGPEVFLKDAEVIGERKRELCERYGHEALLPTDNKVHGLSAERTAQKIFALNSRMIDRADAVIANLSPFRGVSADPGTVFELGYARGSNKMIYGYTSDPRSLVDRVASFQEPQPLERKEDGRLYATDSLWVEEVGLFDNLMIAEALSSCGHSIVVAPRPYPDPWRNLELFEECLALVEPATKLKERAG